MDKSLNDLVTETMNQLKIRARYLKRQQVNSSMQTTEIINESMLRIIKNSSTKVSNKKHFYFLVSASIKNVLIDQYRKSNAFKRQALKAADTFDDMRVVGPDGFHDLLELDDILSQLIKVDKLSGEIIKLKYFMGLNTNEISELLNSSPATISRKIKFARSFLKLHYSKQ